MEFPTPKEMADNQARMKANGAEARMMADDGDKVEAGHFYTVSKSFSRGDGSWTENFWEVLSINGPKAYVKIHARIGHDHTLRFWDIEDRAWYLADDAMLIKESMEQT